ncbi:unnamed protein product [Lactuca virosa]|uniref:Protein root UVB sensitive/RUS domain-containing protein n=1 Tax=Lactuca virosa TaxID=75947 RepID=A0AAU9LW46_9ASTR|nr:unnamed protein product [Lactuca virosa]
MPLPSTCLVLNGEEEPESFSKVKVLNDSRPVIHKISESLVDTFLPSGYPHSVNEGYLRYTQFRALQHFSSAALSVLSTQSLLYAAGLRPTPAQATATSWIHLRMECSMWES